MNITNPFDPKLAPLSFPDHTRIIKMDKQELLSNPRHKIIEALENPINSKPFRSIAKERMEHCEKILKRRATAVLVISDNTRPVPYKGEEDILLPIIKILLEEKYQVNDVTILIATGTHRAMTEDEINYMLDPEILSLGIKVINHDCTDNSMLTYLGRTSHGTEIHINTLYVHADLKIATGLVESHFMAGASGGRKAVCPGLIGEKSTFVFHGAPFMAHANARDLNLHGNPVHEEAVEVASVAGIDFLMNVTLNHAFHITGVFAGNFITAHESAVDFISSSVQVESPEADVVVTHAGFVGINHYQCAKCAVASLGILKENGYLVIIANTTDQKNAVGGINYRTSLALLTLVGPKNFLKIINSEDWTFLPEQWQVQMWTKVFQRIPMDHLIFYAPQMDEIWWPGLPGINGARYLVSTNQEKSNPTEDFKTVIDGALAHIATKTGKSLDELSISWIDDGPYVLPVSHLKKRKP